MDTTVRVDQLFMLNAQVHSYKTLDQQMAGIIVYDVAVIGAGVIGSAAAYQIAKSGAKVVLLEQVQSPCTAL